MGVAVTGLKGKKQAKGRWNFLLMRPQGEVVNFAVSPLLLAVAILFALVFSIGAVLAINQYFRLYLEYQELAEKHSEAQARLSRLDDQYQYQIALTRDYAELLRELNLPDPVNGLIVPEGEPAEPGIAAGELPQENLPEVPPSETADLSEEDHLAAWADLLPALAERIEEKLQVADFKAEGSRFSFQLMNEAAGSLARGRLLILFLVETDGQRQTVPYPDFDPLSPKPDFELAPGYNIARSKLISGQLKVPAGSEILDMMVVAQANDGRVVMKKRIKP
jgi:uncharacterized membrane protein YciS (DUF1049 family)